MSAKQLLIKEIDTLPPQTIEEILNFVTFLKIKKSNKLDTGDILIASERSLAVEWLLPEEDDAWASL
jgi:hypothetical protein